MSLAAELTLRALARLGFWSIIEYAPELFAKVERACGEVWNAADLSVCDTLGPRQLAHIQEGAARAGLGDQRDPDTWRRRLAEVGRSELDTLADGQWVVDSDAPELLDAFAAHATRPPFLFGWGDQRALEANPRDRISVVGSRRCDVRWQDLANEIAAHAAAAGLTLVSGGAIGIDTAAHWGALSAGGRSIAVLPTSLRRPYPTSNRRLFERIADGGGVVLSPFCPSHPTRKHHFVRRNSVIAALSSATVVVRAGAGSGSLTTARAAARLGRVVYAVPGGIDEPDAEGCNALLASGALAICRPEDAVARHRRRQRSRPPRAAPQSEPRSPAVPQEGREIVDLLRKKPLHLDELGRGLGVATPALAARLLELELLGVVQRGPGGVYCTPGPSAR